jgi:REP element-mobilizing transposase RayT
MSAIRDGDSRFRRHDLHAFVIMPNPVHMLVTSLVKLSSGTRSLKGFTGREAGKILGLKSGTTFWLDQSYDHLVRNDEEARNIKRYIEWNPVKAGLADSPETFPYSTGAPGGSRAAGREPRPTMQ